MTAVPELRFVSVLVRDGDGWGVRRHDPAAPLLTAFDYAATRGDGAFEAMHVFDGAANKPGRHLERMARSLHNLQIVGPPYAAWRALVDDLVAQWPAGVEGVLKLIISRGQEGGPSDQDPTVYGTLAPIDRLLIEQRRTGIDVVTLTIGYDADVREQSPWLLGSTKYLSYAVNMAAKREAARRGADDVLFTSADGQALEGPSATILWQVGNELRTTSSHTGILRGTTQEEIFAKAGAHGLAPIVTAATVEDVAAADGVWMTSSTRGVAAVRTLDGRPVRQAPQTTALLQRLSGLPLP
ncbi:aminotransferase class IV [Cumulibacter manganitolerans]|uniref:aminotransferase class IV n=1 Tax=Cumulibacter manganitolerans TaxID=1884992 RepID=UPI0018864784|nr:aminotransferase class IV [Cumulibacter manganitolerans]